MTNHRNVNEHDRQVDRENLEKAREAKGHKEAGKQGGHHRNITEHDRQVDRENLEKAREVKAGK